MDYIRLSGLTIPLVDIHLPDSNLALPWIIIIIFYIVENLPRIFRIWV